MDREKANILLVEDDKNLGFILKDYLEMIGYSVNLEDNGEKGFEAFNVSPFDVCILDIMMPLKDGFTLAKQIRTKSNVPIIFVSAKSMDEDKIKGFRIGADDYLTKPFSTEELSLRIDAILRRYKKSDRKEQTNEFKIGSFMFKYLDQILFSDSFEKRLTKREASVLKILCENINQLVERKTILKKIWGEDDYFMGRSMDVYITKLRKYLKNDNNVSITNIHGTGFKLVVTE